MWSGAAAVVGHYGRLWAWTATPHGVMRPSRQSVTVPLRRFGSRPNHNSGPAHFSASTTTRTNTVWRGGSITSRRYLQTSSGGSILEGEIVTPKQRMHEHNEDLQRQKENDLQEALRHYQQVLDQQQESLAGADSDKNGDVSTDQEAALTRLRNCYEALEYWDDAIATDHAMLELLHPDLHKDRIAATYRRLGNNLWNLNRNVEARRYLHRSLKAFQSLYQCTTDTDRDSTTMVFHKDVGSALNSLASTHMDQNDYETAMPLLEQAERNYRYHGQPFTDNDNDDNNSRQQSVDPGLLQVLENQGLVYRLMGRPADALPKYKEIQSFWEIVHHADPKIHAKNVQGTLLDIADCLVASGHPNEALPYYTSILEKIVEERGPTGEEPELEGVLRHSLGIIHMRNSDMELALKELEKSIVIKKKWLGATSPGVYKTLNALGAIHGTLGHDHVALKYFQEALLIARIRAPSGEENTDPSVMHALRNIAVVEGKNVPKWE